MATTKILTELAVDPALEILPNYVLSAPDRRYLDMQIRGLEQHVVELLIRGVLGTYHELDATSPAVVAGEWGCLAGTGSGNTGLPKVIKATTVPMGTAGVVIGMFLDSAPPGGTVRMATGGVVPPSLTGLGIGDPGFVRLNTGTARAEQVASLGSGDFPLGFVDGAGYLAIVRLSPGTGGGGGGGSSAGAAGEVQYANGVGGFSAEPAFAYDSTANRLTLGSLAFTGFEAITLSGNTNNQALGSTTARLELTNTTGSSVNLTGLTGRAHGRALFIGNSEASNANIVLVNASGSSSVGNRFRFFGNLTLKPGEWVAIIGDDSGADDRWELLVGRISSGAVDSVFGRTGAVVAVASDYNASQIDNDSTVTGAFVDDALDALNSGKANTSHTHTESQITDLSHTDPTAIHDNVAAEISAITIKATPVSADLLVIEDSAAGNAKKRIQIGSLPGVASSGTSGSVQLANGSGGFTSDAELTYNATSNRLKTGSLAANGRQTVTLSSSSTHNQAINDTTGRLTLLNSSGAVRTLTGLVDGTDEDGRILFIGNDPASTGEVILADGDTGSSADNRFSFGEYGTLAPGHYAIIYRDTSGGVGNKRWRLMAGGSASASSQISDDSTFGGDTQSVADSIDELDTAIDGKAATVHTHTESQITDLSHTDPDAIHDNVAGEIAAIASKATPVGADMVLIEDSAAGNVKKRVSLTSIAGLAGTTDASAIHDNVSGEIAAITQKVTPTGSDLLVIEDAAASNAKKRVTITSVVAAVTSAGGAPVDVTKAAASAGVASSFSRSDHKHDVTTAAPAAGAVAVGNAAAPGSATTLSRSDHIHEVSAGAPVNVTKAANAAGSAATFARSDHKHDVTTAVPVSLTDSTNGEGSATTLTRSDHTHAHGDRGGGTLHAVATTTVPGFMSAADKIKVDGLSGSDADAIHDNVSGEIAAITLKGSPVGADLLLIEDSAASNAKKRATVTTIVQSVAPQAHTHDHGSLTGLGDVADHPDYSTTDGTRAFTGTVSGITPVSPTHLVTKAYVDAVAQGLDIKHSVRVVATVNQATLSGVAQTIDGFALNTIGMRVLLTNQNTPTQNGIWLVAAGAWGRPTDFAAGASAASAFTFVESGTVGAESAWVCTSDTGADVIDTNNLAWTQFSGAGQINAGDGLTKTGNTINAVGSASILVTADAIAAIPAGIAHGGLSGLTGDDHAAYMLAETTVNDNRLVRWDGSGGRSVQNSGVTLSDADAMTGLASVAASSFVSIGGTPATAGSLRGNATFTLQARDVANSANIPLLSWASDDLTIGFTNKDTILVGSTITLKGIGWPTVDGAANAVMTTNGAGQLSLVAVTSLFDHGTLGGLGDVDDHLGYVLAEDVATVVDNRLVRWDSATGRHQQNSVGELSDSGALTGLASAAASSFLSIGGTPSTGGDLRGNSTFDLRVRNAANSANVPLINWASDEVTFGDPTVAAILSGTTVTINGIRVSAAGSIDMNGGSITEINDLIIQSNSPVLDFFDTDGSADGKRWRWAAGADDLVLSLRDDATGAFLEDAVAFRRTGGALVEIELGNDSASGYVTTHRTDVSGVVTANIAATTNNYSLGATVSQLRMTATGDESITGITGGIQGRVVYFTNVDATDIITLKHEDTGSTAANRFATPDRVDYPLNPGATVVLFYDDTLDRWRLVLRDGITRMQWRGVFQTTTSTSTQFFLLAMPEHYTYFVNVWATSYLTSEDVYHVLHKEAAYTRGTGNASKKDEHDIIDYNMSAVNLVFTTTTTSIRIDLDPLSAVNLRHNWAVEIIAVPVEEYV